MKKLTKAEAQIKKLNEIEGHDYFDVERESYNEQAGILIGTAVKKVGELKSQVSKYWGGRDYWTVRVECPNGEQKTISIDALKGRKTAKPFNSQRRAMSFTFGKKKAK
jgi:hypothetical protein